MNSELEKYHIYLRKVVSRYRDPKQKSKKHREL